MKQFGGGNPGQPYRGMDGEMHEGPKIKGGSAAQLAAAGVVGAVGFATFKSWENGTGHGARSGEPNKNLDAINSGAIQAKMTPDAYMQDSKKMNDIGLDAVTDKNHRAAMSNDIGTINSRFDLPSDPPAK